MVAEASLHRHEEDAERFLLLSGVLLVITAAGLRHGVPGRAARLTANGLSPSSRYLAAAGHWALSATWPLTVLLCLLVVVLGSPETTRRNPADERAQRGVPA
jgi:hypothetical protein